MLTYNGNEMMLQNDMGNTLIQDSATGNIMGLNPGFIPTGIKEHGGIMYITSVGKDANGNPIGEIGTIPSPIIRDIYKDKITYTVNNFIPIGLGDPLTITHKLYPADKFIVNLNMQVDVSSLIGTKHYKESSLSGNGGKPSGDPSDIVLSRKVVVSRDSNNNPVLKDLYTPLISYADSEDKKVQLLQQTRSTNEVDLFSTKGVYSLDMYSTNVNGSKKVSGPLTYPQQYNGGASKYWYLHNDEYESVFPKDLFEATLNKSLKQFPSSNKPGQLAVKLTPEKIGEFGMLPRKNDPKNTPITVKWGNPTTYISFFPGFYYSTESGVYIDKLNNIKVIDESTEQEIDITPSPNDEVSPNRANDWDKGNREIKFTNILYSPNDFQGQRWGWFDTQSVLWGDFELPQTQSQTSTNHFILSSLADITDYSQTDLVSSDASDNQKHAGLFYAILGTKYNNWYRLELDYYDQYDNLQGSFNTRFNPYINDTFGTNLDITGVEMVDGVAMGGDKIIKVISPEKDVAYTGDYDVTIAYRFPKINGWSLKSQESHYPEMGALFKSKELEEGKFTEYDYSNFTDPRFASKYSADLSKDFIFSVKSPELSNLKYIQDSEATSVKIFYSAITGSNVKPNKQGVTELGIRLPQTPDNLKCDQLHINKWHGINSYYPIGWGTNEVIQRLNEKSIGFRQFYIYDENGEEHEFTISDSFETGTETNKLEKEPFWLTTSTPEEQNLPEGRGFEVTDETIDIFPLTLNITEGKIENNTEVGLVSQKAEIPCIFGTLGTPQDSTNVGTYWDKDHKTSFFAVGGEEGADPHFELISSKHFSDIKYTFNYSLTPAYKITPCFLLTGTADTTSSVYPRRFVSYEKLDQNKGFKYIKDMPYEYNLEKIPAAFNITQDIIQVEESSYLKEVTGYNQNISRVKLTLDAGIYTLNITGVPNNLKDKATITINNTELNIHTQGILKTESGTTIDNQFYFYQPVVFMLEQRSDVTVSVNCGASVDDEVAFQEIGLYKVNTVDVDSISAFIDMYTKAGGLTVCTYKEYMNSLIKTIKAQDSDGQNKELLPSERYALIQKYGIFFKEAYVFTEGLYNATNKTINEVKIADSTNGDSLTYTATPYIPADTSILSVNLQPDLSGELIYAWNIYVMPEEILKTDYVPIPEFVFTNGVPEKVPASTEPKLGNLRMPAQKVFDIDNLWGDKPKDHFGNNNAIGGMLPSVSIK